MILCIVIVYQQVCIRVVVSTKQTVLQRYANLCLANVTSLIVAIGSEFRGRFPSLSYFRGTITKLQNWKGMDETMDCYYNITIT